MSVYVTQIRMLSKPAFGHYEWSHMLADSTSELHAMAIKIGLKRQWFQGHDARPSRHHYDVTPSKRALAVGLGAIETTDRAYLYKLAGATS